MPGAAIEARVIDRTLPAGEIGRALAEMFPSHARDPSGPSSPAASSPAVNSPAARFRDLAPDELERLLPLVLEASGTDFGSYKEETRLRRLESRKSRLDLRAAEDYLALVRRHPDELRRLQQRFLVSVSSFFRDRAAFRELERALAQWLATGGAEAVRVWVPGCASGEEAYSLAILVLELLASGRQGREVRIVGTDLNSEALKVAARGIFPRGVFREMEPDLLARYFTGHGPDFEICLSLREVVKFEQGDVFAGPPLARLALVSCRNLLIYLKTHLQDRLLASIHRALLPKGLLFLGEAETLGPGSVPLFTPVDSRHRIYRRRG